MKKSKGFPQEQGLTGTYYTIIKSFFGQSDGTVFSFRFVCLEPDLYSLIQVSDLLKCEVQSTVKVFFNIVRIKAFTMYFNR